MRRMQRKRKAIPKCFICGEIIDKSACNTERGIFSYYEDTDETGQKIDRWDLCDSCALSVRIKIRTMQIDRHNKYTLIRSCE